MFSILFVQNRDESREAILRWYGYRCFSVCLLTLVAGCGSSNDHFSKAHLEKIAGGKLKEVVPVSGIVTVDGEPVFGVNINLHQSTGGDPIRTVTTDDKGSYCWSTHVNCDGLEPGEYKLTFTYTPKSKPKGRGEDLLKGRYEDPQKSEITLSVQKGTPKKDLKYELTTK